MRAARSRLDALLRLPAPQHSSHIGHVSFEYMPSSRRDPGPLFIHSLRLVSILPDGCSMVTSTSEGSTRQPYGTGRRFSAITKIAIAAMKQIIHTAFQ